MARLIAQRFPDYQLPETKISSVFETRPALKEIQTSKKSGYVANEQNGKPKRSLDYSKFDHIQDSDDEKDSPEASRDTADGFAT
eukprot:Skav233856  [mRNA]  locus=scaffold2112:18164:18545:- [translate_table: standard]